MRILDELHRISLLLSIYPSPIHNVDVLKNVPKKYLHLTTVSAFTISSIEFRTRPVSWSGCRIFRARRRVKKIEQQRMRRWKAEGWMEEERGSRSTGLSKTLINETLWRRPRSSEHYITVIRWRVRRGDEPWNARQREREAERSNGWDWEGKDRWLCSGRFVCVNSRPRRK